MTFAVVYVSGDGRRVHTDELEAVDIDAAAAAGIARTSRFGAGSSWFLAAVVQQDQLGAVSAALEAEL